MCLRNVAAGALGSRATEINRRARLYVCTLPPDQLNPAGYYDGSQTTMLSVSPFAKKAWRCQLLIAMPAISIA